MERRKPPKKDPAMWDKLVDRMFEADQQALKRDRPTPKKPPKGK